MLLPEYMKTRLEQGEKQNFIVIFNFFKHIFSMKWKV